MQEPYKREIDQGCSPCKILRTILVVDQRRTKTNRPENKKTKSLLIAAQNNAIRTTHIKARCGDRDEMINHKISKCSKLSQKEYKTRHHRVGKVIPWELCKKFKFDLMNKWYMHNPISVLENETHKLLWDFEIQTDHLILANDQT